MTEKKKRELLQLYISGKISPEDRHTLEVEAVDDIFLFEALEGYSTHKPRVTVPYSTKEPARILPISQMLAMAASFLLIAAIAFVFNQYNTPSINENAIAQFDNQGLKSESTSQKKKSAVDITSIEMEDRQERDRDIILQSRPEEMDELPIEFPKRKTVSTTTATPDPPQNRPSNSNEGVDVDLQIIDGLVEAASTYNTQAESPVPKIPLEEQIDTSTEIATLLDVGNQDEESESSSENTDNKVFADQSVEEDRSTIAQDANEGISTKARRALPSAAQAREEVKPFGIIGIVKDLQSGEPLIGANVVIEGTDTGTITDINGRFTLPYDGNRVDLYVDYTGFETAYITASLEKENEIFLESGQLLDEVVVTGFSKQQQKNSPNLEEPFPYVINGIVKNSENGNRLAGAKVKILNTRISTISDNDGWFSISFPKPKYKMRTRHRGYQSSVWEGYFRNEEQHFMVIDLSPNGTDKSEDIETQSQFFKIETEGPDALIEKKSLPAGGWIRFNEELKKFKDSSLCAFDQITTDFQIQEDGTLNDLEVQFCSYLDFYTDEELQRCFRELESFIKDFETWETIPPNIVLPQRLTISQDTIECNFGFW